MNVLLGASRPLSVSQLRELVSDYPSDEASFRRAFERDKSELRNMGVPLLVESIAGTNPPATGYRIKLADWSLRDPGLDEDELEALRLAAMAVGAEGGLGSRALYKLGAAPGTARAQIPAGGPAADAFRGVLERRRLRFRYKDQDRRVDPYRLSFVRGRWYLNGFDHTRNDNRWFRLPRIEGDITVEDPSGAFERPDEPLPELRLDPWEFGGADEPVAAEVWFDPDVRNTVLAGLDKPDVISDDDDGLVVRLEVRNLENFRAWLLSFLDRAEVRAPAEVRADVVAWLSSVAGEAR